MARPLTTIVVAMASFADTHLQSSSMLKVASTILGSGKYIMDQELRAQQASTRITPLQNEEHDLSLRFAARVQ